MAGASCWHCLAYGIRGISLMMAFKNSRWMVLNGEGVQLPCLSFPPFGLNLFRIIKIRDGFPF